MSDTTKYQYALFVLGAGFSRPAGLPLGIELFEEVRKSVSQLHGSSNALEIALEDYCRYINQTYDSSIDQAEVDYEEFMGFLDVEHFLGLDGPETISEEGNAAQLLLKKGIGDLLQHRTEAALAAPHPVYEKFVQLLKPRDVVLTLNYDSLLERMLEMSGIPYRLFPTRLESFNPLMSTVDKSKDEVVVLKLHGSVDWFDRRPFDDLWSHSGSEKPPRIAPFGDESTEFEPLVDGPWDPEDPLLSIYRAKGGSYWTSRGRRAPPFLLSPSYQKLLYSSPIRSLWWGLGYAGTRCSRFCVVGYSLPSHDDYFRQVLYRIVQGFHSSTELAEAAGFPKRPISIIDYRASEKQISDLRERYRFAIDERTHVDVGGFNEEAIDRLQALWA